MEYAYIVSKENLEILDICNVTDYQIVMDAEFAGMSTIRIERKPKISNESNDYLFLKDDKGSIFFYGVIDGVTNESGQNLHSIQVSEIENIFDRKIFIDGESLIKTNGIEDFIKYEIEKEFSNGVDSLLNMQYVSVTVLTHTIGAAAVSTEDGIYNFKTYLGNAREYYGIFLFFEFLGNELVIKIGKREQPKFKFNASDSDVKNYLEDYSVDALTKLSVRWKIPDTEDDNGNTVIGAVTDLVYFLNTERMIITDIDDVNRAAGNVDCMYLEAESMDGVKEEVTNKFKSNAYEHSVTADVRIGSKIYPESQFFICHECMIKTKSNGVKNSQVTRIEKNRNSKYLSVKFGNLAITLIEKLRKERMQHEL